MRLAQAVFFVCTVSLCFPTQSVFAQDPFEIHIYEYETLKRGQFTLENHSNYTSTDKQFHSTFELTAGVIDAFSIGFMQLNGVRPGSRLQYAGWRLLPHMYAPKSWHLPVDLGLVTELSFQSTTFEENPRRLEVRPIIERAFGRVQLDMNPVLERALKGPDRSRGWFLEPGARVGFKATEHLTPSLEYYSSIGPVRDFPPLQTQFHQMLPGVDIHAGEGFTWSLGVGFGLTETGNRIVYKSRIEWKFDRKDNPDD